MPVAQLLDPDLEVVDYRIQELPKGYELIDGELMEMTGMGFQASWVASELHGLLRDHVKANRCGVAVTAEASYSCFPHRDGQVRKPDVSVILGDPARFVPPDPHCKQVPALVVEVQSPYERASELDDKIDDFLQAGTKLVWVINPVKRRVVIHYPDLTTRQIGENGTLTGEDVLPGFAIPLSSILPPKTAIPNA